MQGEKWFLIDDTGKTVSDNYEDMKLDLYGSYVQGGVILAKKDGAYHIYDLEENQIGDFSCDGMDICIDGGLIAFKQGDKWGYVDVEEHCRGTAICRCKKFFRPSGGYL